MDKPQRFLIFFIGLVFIPFASVFMSFAKEDMAVPYTDIERKDGKAEEVSYQEGKVSDFEIGNKEDCSATKSITDIVDFGNEILRPNYSPFFSDYSPLFLEEKEFVSRKPHELYVAKGFKKSYSYYDSSQGWRRVEIEEEIPEDQQTLIEFNGFLFSDEYKAHIAQLRIMGSSTTYIRNGDILKVIDWRSTIKAPQNTVYYKLIEIKDSCINQEE